MLPRNLFEQCISAPFATNRRWFDDYYKIGLAIGVNIDQIGFAKYLLEVT